MWQWVAGSGRARIWQALDGAAGDRPDELGVVSRVLVGVLPGESAEFGGELGPLADVAVDGDRIAASGVGPGQRLAAGGGELDQTRGYQLGAGDDLHVAELPHVVVLPVQRSPADEDVGGALELPLPADHARAVIAV